MKYHRMKKRCGVYLIRCRPTGKIYIGYASDLMGRIQTHLQGIRNRDKKMTNVNIVAECQQLNLSYQDFDFQFIMCELSTPENQKKAFRAEQEAIQMARKKGYKLYNIQ